MNDDALLDAVLAYTNAHPGINGMVTTCAPRLHIFRGDRQTPLEHAFYEPALIVVIQGSKELTLGDALFKYTAGQYLVMSVGMPVLASITHASEGRPYLALALTIDPAMTSDLVREIGPVPAPAHVSQLGLYVGTLDGRQADAFSRLAALLPTPDAMRVLYPSIEREILYWMLVGAGGTEVRRLAARDGHAQRIADAITVIRGEISSSVSIERLARVAHMSVSSFHHHFKLVTSMSPLQYHKQLRLLEARQLMLRGDADATGAAYHVGYESASQFSREYARMFGSPPRRDVAGLRSAVT